MKMKNDITVKVRQELFPDLGVITFVGNANIWMIPKCFEKKANKVVGCVWGIEEKKWGGDFRRRMMMFESLIEKSILMYGAEIWE
jgi:hypothetical protein